MKIEHPESIIEGFGYTRTNLCFPITEYQSRLKKVRKNMAKQGIDALITTTAENIFYLTGYQTLGYWYFQALVIPLKNSPFMVVRNLEVPNIVERTYISDYYSYSDNANPIELFCNALKNQNLDKSHLGFEYSSYFLRNTEFKEIQKTLTNATFMDISNTVEQHRKIKSSHELKMLKKAGYFTNIGIKTALEATKIGCTENDIATGFYQGAIGSGGHYMAMPPFVASGPRSYLPHATYMNRTIEPNEFILLEGAGSYMRYHSPCMRTIYTGKPKPWHKDIESILKEALTTTIKSMVPGRTANDIDKINQTIIERNKFGGLKTSRTGYSVGIAFSPDWGEGHIISLVEGNETILKKNMVFHVLSYIEVPSSNFSVKSRFGISETVYITEQGGVSLVNLPHEIIFIY